MSTPLVYESQRLLSFRHGWPADSPASPIQLAAAGFYYMFTLGQDRVMCAFCQKVFRDWRDEDDPMEEHKRLSPGCPFVQGKASDNVTLEAEVWERPAINEVLDDSEDVPHVEDLPEIVEAEATDSDQQSQGSASGVSDVYSSLSGMGFSEADITMALQLHHIELDGEPDVEDLLVHLVEQQRGDRSLSRSDDNRPDSPQGNVEFQDGCEPTEFVDSDQESDSGDIMPVSTQLEHLISGDETQITVQRANVVSKVLDLYKSNDILQGRLHVKFEGEDGFDLGGLTRELFTLFWTQVTDEQLFAGEHCVVPSLPLNKMRPESWKFVSLGRILAHTVALTGTIPANLSLALLAAIAGKSLSEDILVEDFSLYVTDSQKLLLQKALNSFEKLDDKEMDRLSHFFTASKFFDTPKANSIREQILDIAEEELVRKPAPLVQCMKNGIPESHLEAFWDTLTIENLKSMLMAQKPTAEKVLEVMTTDPEDLTDQESTAFFYLQEFIRGLTPDELQDFLLFCTGSVHQPLELKVTFTSLVGMRRRPIAHTCSNILELPKTYSSLQEFRGEFKQLLESLEARQYSAV